MAEKPTKKKALSDSEIVSRIQPLLTKAQDTGDASAKREQALNLYTRAPFPGDEDIAKGRSRYQTSDMFDQTEMNSAQMLAIFEGQEDVVTFEPTGPEDIELAEQQTAVVNHVLRNDNELSVLLTDWFKNGYIHALGVAVAEFYDEVKFKPAKQWDGVPEHEQAKLRADPLIDIRAESEPYDVPAPEMLPGLGAPLDPTQPAPTMPVRDLLYSKGQRKCGVRLMVIPPEDVILSADAKFSYQTGGIDAALQGYKTVMSRRELIDMGYDEALVESIPVAQSDNSGVSGTRNRWNEGGEDGTSDVEPEVNVYELFTHLNVDGAKRTPLMHFTLAGELGGALKLLDQEEVEMAPLAAFVPSLSPNTIHGMGLADMIGKDQKFKSVMYRGLQDNMHQQLYPRPIINTSTGIDMDDLLSDDIGAIIRTEGAEAISHMQVPAIAPMVFPVIERVNQDIETRTGTGVNTLALNPEDLKKTTATGVSQRTSASMLRIEQTARIFAGTGYRYLFRVIGSLLASHPEETQTLLQRLRNKVVPMAADQWDTAMDVRANVSFGNTDKPQKTQTLMNILNLQKEAMGAGMPLVGMEEIYHTVSAIITLNGFKNTSKFMKDPASMPPQDPAADKPDPEVLKAQAEMQMKMQMRQLELQQEMQIAQMKLSMEREIAMYEADLKFQIAQKEMGAEIMMQGTKMQMGAEVQGNIANPMK